jgi:molybdopterin-binding protein
MEMSARNQLRGTIKALKQGGVMAEVIVALPGGQQITSVITVDAVQALNLHEGDQVTAIIKSTEVMIGKDA